jgi:hypothetical protein
MRGGNDNVTATQENTMRLLDILENGGRVAGQKATDLTGTRESIMKKNERTLDRAIRVVLGIGLLSLLLVWPAQQGPLLEEIR